MPTIDIPHMHIRPTGPVLTAHDDHEDRRAKVRAVERLGFDVLFHEPPLEAWYRGLCDLNDLHYGGPDQPLPLPLATALRESRGARAFLLVLA